MSVTAAQVLSLYRALLREGKRFTDYNVRCYALRRIRDDFRAHKVLDNPAEIKRYYQYGREQLDVVRRQVALNMLYKSPANVLETAHA